MWAYAESLAAVKRNDIQDDIISKLITPDEAGNVLSEMEFDLFFMLLAVAGNETTRNAISGRDVRADEASRRVGPSFRPTRA